MKADDKAKAGFVGVRKRRGRVKALADATARELPAVPEILRPEIDAARQTHKARPASPGVRVYPHGEDGWTLDAPHRDLEAWEVQICEAFATRSHAVMWIFLNQIAALCEQRYVPDKTGDAGRWMPDEMELNFILAMIHAERPDTPLQAAMLAQMVATHMLQLRLSERALGSSGYVDPNRALLAAKLGNAFATQSDAYLRLRGKAPKQQITVTYRREVHIHHHSHKHAHLHANPPGDGEGENFERPHEANTGYGKPIGEPESRPALPGPDATGNVVPIANHPRESSVQTPRRSQSRRSEG